MRYYNFRTNKERQLLCKYIREDALLERIGTGTTDVIEECRDAGLESPLFEQDGDFKVTIWRKKHSADRNEHIADTKTHIVGTKTHIADIKLSKKQISVIDFCETPKTLAIEDFWRKFVFIPQKQSF